MSTLTADRVRWATFDINSYFASIEQAHNPKLQGLPLAVCATAGDNGTVIAASYPAKAYGVYTGIKVGEAKRLCPDIILVTDPDHSLYSHYKDLIGQAVESVIHVHEQLSIDEFRIKLLGPERDPEEAVRVVKKVKAAVAEQVSPAITMSAGIAPNPFLAKVGTKMQKPNGLVVLAPSDLPHKLYSLKLTDFPGINRRMLARLQAAGIFTTHDMCTATPEHLVRAFGSIVGERWSHWLRGTELDVSTKKGKSLGHSHVLPPNLRTDKMTREVLMRLTTKACARMRKEGFSTSHVWLKVTGIRQSWEADMGIDITDDTHAIIGAVCQMWEQRDFSMPIKVSVTFTHLLDRLSVTPSLFDDRPEKLAKASHAVDKVNQKYAKNRILLANYIHAKDSASEKIAFQKMDLFSEGKDDNVWSSLPESERVRQRVEAVQRPTS